VPERLYDRQDGKGVSGAVTVISTIRIALDPSRFDRAANVIEAAVAEVPNE
jgi:hypothetical protein